MDTIPRVELASGYTISRVLKGGWQLAGGHGPVDGAAALDDMDRFVEAGVTTFDCADIYTGVEALIGRWLKRRKGRAAADVQVHTKYVPDLDRLPAHSRADVVRGVDRSLARLGRERLDLVQLHWWDYGVGGYVEAAVWLDELRRAGKIRHVGLTNFDQQRLSEIVAGGATMTSHQVQYSMIDRRPEVKMAEFCRANGVALLTYGTVCGGLLSDRYLGAPEPRRAELNTASLQKYKQMIDAWGGWELFQKLLASLAEIARKHGVSIANVATRYILDKPAVAGLILGVRLGVSAHLEDNARVFGLKLDNEDLARIDAVLSGSRDLFAAIGDCGDEYR